MCAGCGPRERRSAPRAARVRRPVGLPPGTPLGLAEGPPDPLLQLEWCAPFAGTTRHALHALKYAGERRLAGPLGRRSRSAGGVAGAGGDLLVPVPVHAARRRERGYDQAELIAAAAAGRLRLPWRAARSSAPGRPPPSSAWTAVTGRRTSHDAFAVRPAGTGRRRGPVGRAGGRRRHDRRDAVRGGASAARRRRRGRERRDRGARAVTGPRRAAAATGTCGPTARSGRPWLYSSPGRSPIRQAPPPQQPGARIAPGGHP